MWITQLIETKRARITCSTFAAAAAAVVWLGPLFLTPPRELQGTLLGVIFLLCGLVGIGQCAVLDPFRFRLRSSSTHPFLYNGRIRNRNRNRGGRVSCVVLVLCGLGLGAAGDVLRGLFSSDARLMIVQRHAATPGIDDGSVRVLNMNVLHGYPEFSDQEARYQRTLEAFRNLDADVLVLQEVWSTREHGHLADRLANDLGMNVAYARANGSLRFLGFEEGSAVLSRYPIESAESIVLKPRLPVWESRIAVVARLDVGKRRPLTVVSTHLSDKNLQIAKDQADFLADRVPDADLIAGDFNAGSESEALDRFLSDGWCDTVPGGIDHILVDVDATTPWRIQQADWALLPDPVRDPSRSTFAISDHPAILVDLQARSPQRVVSLPASRACSGSFDWQSANSFTAL